jgi:hypothetical protein
VQQILACTTQVTELLARTVAVPNEGTCGSPPRGMWRDISDSQLFGSNRAIIGRLVPDQPPFTEVEATAMSLLNPHPNAAPHGCRDPRLH